MRQSGCIVIDIIMDDSFSALLNCTPVGRASDSMMFRPKVMYFSRLGPELSRLLLLVFRDQLMIICLIYPVVLFWQSSDLQLSHSILYLLSPHFCFFSSPEPKGQR